MDDKTTLLKLWLLPNIGPKSIYFLLNKFKPLASIFKYKNNDLLNKFFVPQRIITAINNPIANKLLENELKLLDKHKINYLPLWSEKYPASLKEIYAPPPLLYYKGNLNYEQTKTISVVGSRVASYYGVNSTKKIISEIASIDNNFTIVSGLARGIDTIAHKHSLVNKLNTIAVLGNGLSMIYPYQNYKLAEKILENNGIIFSELPINTKPLPRHFPMRNRIISGLSQVVLIMEASIKSGSLITAKFGFEQNRDVFALPGNVDLKSFQGTNSLIRNELAKILTSGEDIINCIDLKYNHSNKNKLSDLTKTSQKPTDLIDQIEIKNLNSTENLILELLLEDPLPIEEICNKTALDSSKILASLTNLELNGYIECVKNGIYQIIANIKHIN